MKWINYHHLIYFKVIANSGGISKASKLLKVGQPALSSQLKNLEDYLGVQLFERKNKKLILTEAGKMALEYARKISDLGQELLEVIDDKVYRKRVELNLGALDSIPKHLICDIVDFAHKKTGCFLSIYEGASPSLLKKLTGHTIDLIVSDHELETFHNDKIFSKKIVQQPIVAYASPEFKDLRKNFPNSLDDTPCILPTGHSRMRQEIEHYFYLNKLRPKIIAQTQDTTLQKILATKGGGVIFLPKFSAKELIKEKKLIKIGELENIFSEFYLIYSKKTIENPALQLITNQDFSKMRLG